jgi:hypothetical protein
MNYLVLGKPHPKSTPNYRGVYRSEPEHPDNPDLFDLWDWYSKETYEHSYVQDPQKARELIQSYGKQNMIFELIGVSQRFETESNTDFLGIDVATEGNFSILDFGLIYDFSNDLPDPLEGISEVVSAYFRPKLNNNVLFDNLKDAVLFSKVVKEMQAACPGYFAYDDFNLHFVYLVSD